MGNELDRRAGLKPRHTRAQPLRAARGQGGTRMREEVGRKISASGYHIHPVPRQELLTYVCYSSTFLELEIVPEGGDRNLPFQTSISGDSSAVSRWKTTCSRFAVRILRTEEKQQCVQNGIVSLLTLLYWNIIAW